jgi:hypothetical protein
MVISDGKMGYPCDDLMARAALPMPDVDTAGGEMKAQERHRGVRLLRVGTGRSLVLAGSNRESLSPS